VVAAADTKHEPQIAAGASMKILASVCAGLAVLLFVGAAGAARNADKPQKSAKGEIVKIDGKNVVVKTAKGAEVTVATDDTTTFQVEGVKADLTKLKAGQKVTIALKNGVATKVTVPKPKDPNAPKTPKTPKTPNDK
jgi:hypothetical protein